MRDRPGGQPEAAPTRPLWVDGDLMFRIIGRGAEPDRLVKVRRPFARLGRARDADVPIDDRAASGHHAYLHLDRRGLYVVDLVTRTGTRLNGVDVAVAWARPGDRIEVAGRAVEVVRLRIDGRAIEPPPCDDDLLIDAGRDDLPTVMLDPGRQGESPWVLSSELVFLGWSASCGIQVRDPAVARTHCAIVRAPAGAFLVNLCGRQTWVEDQPVEDAAELQDGDLITIGSTRFTAQFEPVTIPRADEPPAPAATFARLADSPSTALTPLVTASPPTELLPALPALPDLDVDALPAEARSSLLAWMVGAIQGGQHEVLRQQGEFQQAVTQALRQIQHDSAAILTAQLERIESIDRELATLRAELVRRHVQPPPPDVEPLRIARPEGLGSENPADPTTTAWLLDRVAHLESENRSAWKDLFGRLSQSRKAT